MRLYRRKIHFKYKSGRIKFGVSSFYSFKDLVTFPKNSYLCTSNSINSYAFLAFINSSF